MDADDGATDVAEDGVAVHAVFVDESGRRRRLVRVCGLVLAGLMGSYLLLLIVGLVGPASFPGAHLAGLGRLHVSRGQSSVLGRGAKAVALPGVFGASGQPTN